MSISSRPQRGRAGSRVMRSTPSSSRGRSSYQSGSSSPEHQSRTSESSRVSNGNRSFRGRPSAGSRPTSSPFRNTDRRSASYGRGTPSRGGGRPAGNRGRGRQKDAPIDISRFINENVEPTTAPDVYEPIHTFSDFALVPELAHAVASKGYVTPTPIQDKSIPHILRGRDIIGLANTGSGKTAAFLIPLIQKLLLIPDEQILVLAPTRELALQIEAEFVGLTRGLKLYSVVLVGGMPIGPQMRKLRSRNHLIVGTPGRVMDLMERRSLNLARTKTVVLDEADRMLDMGFIGDMRKILCTMSTPRHTLFFSATLSREIEKLVSDFSTDPVTVSVRTRDTSKNIHQSVIKVNGRDKVSILLDLLQQEGFGKVIVFGRTKHGVEKLSVLLKKRGIVSESIHGNKTHNQRVRSLEAFKRGRAQVLIATDVAARGLDIPDVSHVINYELPGSHDDYIHRIGRTGRADKSGCAITLVD